MMWPFLDTIRTNGHDARRIIPALKIPREKADKDSTSSKKLCMNWEEF